MGVHARIWLPDDVRVKDVASVIGILAGCPKEWNHAKLDAECKWVHVNGVKIESFGENLPSCCRIIVTIPEGWGLLVDKERVHHAMYHFEGDVASGGRLMRPPSTPFWIAVGTGLCRFFGGWIDYADCDATDVNRRFRKPRPTNRPNAMRPWRKFQEELATLRPVTEAEFTEARKNAHYDMETE